MPFATHSGVKIYWDEAGEGEPVLLIMGLGSASALWHRIRPALATQYRTIAFDNRGVGQSDVPAAPYSMQEMAADAVAVLDAANVPNAHVFGLSMGGMIAQEFALQYPDRVRSLILACTSPGGENAVQADPEVQTLFRSLRSMSPEEGTEAAVPILHAAGIARARIEEDLALRRKWHASADGYRGQWQAIRSWEAFSRLHRIQAPSSSFTAIAIVLFPRATERFLQSASRTHDLCLYHTLVTCFLRINRNVAKRKSWVFESAQEAIGNRQ